MDQSLDIFSKNLLHMMRGALMMLFVVMASGLYPKRKQGSIPNYLFWLVVAMAAFLAVSFSLMLDQVRSSEVFLNFVVLLDLCLVPMVASFFLKIVIPERINGRRMFLMLIPAIVCMTVYSFTHNKLLLTLSYVYSALVAAVVFGFVVYFSLRYDRILKNNYSNIDNKDLGWVRATIYIFAAWYIAWGIIKAADNRWLDSIYYIFLISIWSFIYRHSVRHVAAVNAQELFEGQQIEELPDATEAAKTDSATKVIGATNALDSKSVNTAGAENTPDSDLIDMTSVANALGFDLERYMRQEQLWLNPSLTLQELAVVLNTNRTYLSEYFNNTLDMTFYDYINGFRIRHACEILVSKPELSLTAVGERSGFNSLSTFRRAFEKSVGGTPTAYRNRK